MSRKKIQQAKNSASATRAKASIRMFGNKNHLLAAVFALSFLFSNPPSVSADNTIEIDADSVNDPSYKAASLANEGLDYIAKNNWAKARSLLESAVKFDPNESSCMVHSNLALVLEHFNEFDKALVHLKYALKAKPKDEAALENLGSYYQQVGNSTEAVKYFDMYLALYPKSTDAVTVNNLVKQLRLKIGSPVNAIAVDYYEDTRRENFCHFKTPRAALKVFVEPAENVQGYKKEYGDYLTAALDAWTKASKVLTWQFVDDKDAADIVWTWTGKLDNTDRALSEAGKNRSHVFGNEIRSSAITIFTLPLPGATVTDDSIRFVCLHELGHALGLIGHSPNKDDVMFYSEREVKPKGLTERDKATIARLYKSPI